MGVMLPTCAEWTVSQLALWSQSLTTVTLYETYGPDAISFILKQAELSIVITIGSKVQQLIDLAGASHLKIIVCTLSSAAAAASSRECRFEWRN